MSDTRDSTSPDELDVSPATTPLASAVGPKSSVPVESDDIVSAAAAPSIEPDASDATVNAHDASWPVRRAKRPSTTTAFGRTIVVDDDGPSNRRQPSAAAASAVALAPSSAAVSSAARKPLAPNAGATTARRFGGENLFLASSIDMPAPVPVSMASPASLLVPLIDSNGAHRSLPSAGPFGGAPSHAAMTSASSPAPAFLAVTSPTRTTGPPSLRRLMSMPIAAVSAAAAAPPPLPRRASYVSSLPLVPRPVSQLPAARSPSPLPNPSRFADALPLDAAVLASIMALADNAQRVANERSAAAAAAAEAFGEKCRADRNDMHARIQALSAAIGSSRITVPTATTPASADSDSELLGSPVPSVSAEASSSILAASPLPRPTLPAHNSSSSKVESVASSPSSSVSSPLPTSPLPSPNSWLRPPLPAPPPPPPPPVASAPAVSPYHRFHSHTYTYPYAGGAADSEKKRPAAAATIPARSPQPRPSQKQQQQSRSASRLSSASNAAAAAAAAPSATSATTASATKSAPLAAQPPAGNEFRRLLSAFRPAAKSLPLTTAASAGAATGARTAAASTSNDFSI